MPKSEILHRSGTRLGSDLRQVLLQYFDKDEIEKLERLGGRVLISIAAPYAGKAGEIELDEEFLKQLAQASDSPDTLFELLSHLTKKQMMELGDKIGIPLRKSGNAGDMRQDLIRFLQSEHIWDRIIGTDRETD